MEDFLSLDILSVISAVARQLLGTVLFNFVFIILYILIIAFIKHKIDRQSEVRENATGAPGRTARAMIEEVILVSFITGFIASIAIVFIGISLDISVIPYLFIIMILLSIINPRFACFSYAGGLMALASAVLGIPGFSPSSLIALIAIAHLAESVLVFMFGAKNTIPVYIKHGDGIAGAFIIQRFWPLPLIFVVSGIQSVAGGGMESLIKAGWWPVFRSVSTTAGIITLGLGCVAAFVSYSDIAVSRLPEKKAREKSLLDLCYAAVLMAIAFFARNSQAISIVGALAAIILHEGISIFSRLRDNRHKPLFKAEKRGLKVFEVPESSHAWDMGIKRGDIILSVNDRDIQTAEGLAGVLNDFPTYLWVRIITLKGVEKLLEYRFYPEGVNNLGIISVPRQLEVTYNVDNFENFSIIKNLVARFKGNIR